MTDGPTAPVFLPQRRLLVVSRLFRLLRRTLTRRWAEMLQLTYSLRSL